MRAQLKVLQVVPSVGPLRGGPSLWLHTLARGLARAGLEVHVATTDDNGPDRLPVPCGVPVTDDGVTYHYFRRQVRAYTVSWPLGRWLARRVRAYDLVHVHALFSYATLPATWWAHRYGVPYVVRPLGTLNRWGMQHRRRLLKALSLRLLERRILARAAAIHYTSEQEREEAAALGVDGAAVVIPNAVDLSRIPRAAAGQLRARHPRLAGRTVILFLSRLDPKKGLDLLLPAFARVHRTRPQASLVIAGDGDAGYVARVKRQVAALRLDDAVLWTGFLGETEKWAALADADLFVLPSYSENFGVAVVEAMACGIPVVISDQVGIHQEVAHAGAGTVVRCAVDPLVEAMITLIDDAAQRARLGRSGAALVRSHFSVTSVTAQLLTLYEAIARRATGPLRA